MPVKAAKAFRICAKALDRTRLGVAALAIAAHAPRCASLEGKRAERMRVLSFNAALCDDPFPDAKRKAARRCPAGLKTRLEPRPPAP
jgi:hypothetical protein